MLSAITLSLQLQRASFDLLDGLSIEVAAHNTNKAPVSVRFDSPTEYAIDVVRDGNVVWSSNSQNPAPSSVPAHVRQFMPGPTVLSVYIWNETTNAGTSITPGDYIIRGRLLSQGNTPQTSLRVHFSEPTPISALSALHAGDEVTIAGRLDDTKQVISDSTGSIALTKRLLNAADAPVAVRGYMTTSLDKERVFFVERWARLGN